MEELRLMQGYGADLTTRNFQGKTGLYMAASRPMSHHSVDSRECEKQRENLNLFIKAGVAPSSTDYAGNTALYDAMENTGPLASTTTFLLETALEVGIDPETGKHQGRTILHTAAALPFLEHCRYSRSDCEVIDFVL